MPACWPKPSDGMLAIDTNVIVRYLTGDHPEQSERAKALIDGRPVFVATTVLLETEWVLRSTYGFAASDIVKALVGFVGLPTVTLEDAGLAAKALDGAAQGLDFADALHLAAAQGRDGFATFDQRFIARAKLLGDFEVSLP